MQFSRRMGLTLLGAAALGCGGAEPGRASAAGGNLPPWIGPMQQLFDDRIDSAAVGLSTDGRAPHEDPLLRYRTRAADLVARVRVQTVSREQLVDRARFLIVLQVGVPALMPARLPDHSIELVIPESGAAFGLVSSYETTLRGRTFIGFVRRFAGAEGPEIHWHLTADTAEVARAIQQIAALEAVTGS